MRGRDPDDGDGLSEPRLFYSCGDAEYARAVSNAATLWHLGAYSVNLISARDEDA